MNKDEVKEAIVSALDEDRKLQRQRQVLIENAIEGVIVIAVLVWLFCFGGHEVVTNWLAK